MSGEQHDPAMQRAIERAQQSFPFFWRELSWEYRRIIPGLDFAAIKLPFKVSAEVQAKHNAPQVEHMWVGDVQFDGHTLSGELLNSANFIPHLQAGTEVSAPLADLEDWMYTSLGVLCGGFTVQAIRASMSERERAEHDKAWGQPFPDPALCNITSYDKPAPEQPTGLSRLWKKAPAPSGLPFDEAMRLAREKEHPMSENMRERYATDLKEQPGMVTQVFDDGWTLLQRDALAGNLAPVEVLYKLGADAHQLRTPQGDTALELAQRMGWTRVVAALR